MCKGAIALDGLRLVECKLPVDVARSILDLCQHIGSFIGIVRYAEHIVHAIELVVEVHSEVIRQASLLVSLYMRRRCYALHVCA